MVKSTTHLKRFPRALVSFIFLLEGEESNIPSEVNRILQASKVALLSKNPRVSLNKHFCGLRSAHPSMFPNVLEWLYSNTAAVLFSKSGNFWARLELIGAFKCIKDGEKPHVALGMNIGGRPSQWEFTKNQDAAIYAQHLHLNKGYTLHKAKLLVENTFKINKAVINEVKLPHALPLKGKRKFYKESVSESERKDIEEQIRHINSKLNL